MKFQFKSSIRYKLIFGFLFVVIVTGLSSIFVGYKVINSGVVDQAYETVMSDLNTAKYVYNKRLIIMKKALNYIATLDNIKQSLIRRDKDFIQKRLIELSDWMDVDIIIVTDEKGNVIERINNRQNYGDSVLDITCIRGAIKSGELCSGTNILSPDILKREGKSIAEGAVVKVVPTKMGQKTAKKFERRAMVLDAACPVYVGGKLRGIIYGANILNNDFEIVDRIQDISFKSEKIEENLWGNATIFLDDIRVSTNVFESNGKRTVGTQVSSQVYEKVYGQGTVWLDKAFVVDKWYLAAYGPIRDSEEKVIGILYVGIPEERFSEIKNRTTAFFLGSGVLTAFFAVFISLYLVRSIVRPINEVVAASEEIGKGNFSRKIQIFSDDETGYLARAFNKMIDEIAERDARLRENTQKQLLRSEKLASLGRLASGIAHEINNPLTGILSFSSMLKKDLEGTEYEPDLDIIIDETMRCRKIVRGVLDFARETKLEKETVDFNGIINGSIKIMDKNFNFQNVNIIRELQDNLPLMNVDVGQMKSVISNLAVNAADAMPGGGDLRIKTSFLEEEKCLELIFSDMGTGIEPEDIDRIFDPFFTTKEPGKGTGLGLAVIYGIVEGHGGHVEVKSTPGVGTDFIIKLPAGTS